MAAPQREQRGCERCQAARPTAAVVPGPSPGRSAGARSRAGPVHTRPVSGSPRTTASRSPARRRRRGMRPAPGRSRRRVRPGRALSRPADVARLEPCTRTTRVAGADQARSIRSGSVRRWAARSIVARARGRRVQSTALTVGRGTLDTPGGRVPSALLGPYGVEVARSPLLLAALSTVAVADLDAVDVRRSPPPRPGDRRGRRHRRRGWPVGHPRAAGRDRRCGARGRGRAARRPGAARRLR